MDNNLSVVWLAHSVIQSRYAHYTGTLCSVVLTSQFTCTAKFKNMFCYCLLKVIIIIIGWAITVVIRC